MKVLRFHKPHPLHKMPSVRIAFQAVSEFVPTIYAIENNQEPCIDFKNGGHAKLWQFLGLGYIPCIQKILFSEKWGHDPRPPYGKAPDNNLIKALER